MLDTIKVNGPQAIADVEPAGLPIATAHTLSRIFTAESDTNVNFGRSCTQNPGSCRHRLVVCRNARPPSAATYLTFVIYAAPLTSKVLRTANAARVRRGVFGCDGGSSLRRPVVRQHGRLQYARSSRRCRSSATSAVDRPMPRRRYACHSLRRWKDWVSRPGATLQSSIASLKARTNVYQGLRQNSFVDRWLCWSLPIDHQPWQQNARARQFPSYLPVGSTRSSSAWRPASTGQAAMPPV